MSPTNGRSQSTGSAAQILPELAFDLLEGKVRPTVLGKTNVPVVILPAFACDLVRLVPALATGDLARACRVFLDLAYPDGAETIPVNKRAYFDIGADSPIEDFIPPAKVALSVCQELPRRQDAQRGYAFRLGSAAYPHLKLCVQPILFRDHPVWVYSVDTHDGGAKLANLMPPGEAHQWRAMIGQNRRLKEEIESALALAGFLTPNNLLQLDLPAPASPR